MTRPIKKARVTRRRKYYGGGKKRGGTTLKKVGGIPYDVLSGPPKGPNEYATWTAALRSLIHHDLNYDNLFIAKNTEGEKITLGQWKEIIQAHAIPKGSDIEKIKKYDLGGGDQDKIKKLIKKREKGNQDFNVEQEMEGIKKQDFLSQEGTLITGGTEENRLINLNKFINEGFLNKKSYALIPKMETKLTAISYYDKACELLDHHPQFKTLCLIPVGSTDAHIITYTKNDGGEVNVEYETYCEFATAKDPAGIPIPIQLEKCDKYIFAGSGPFYIDTPNGWTKRHNKYLKKDEIWKTLNIGWEDMTPDEWKEKGRPEEDNYTIVLNPAGQDISRTNFENNKDMVNNYFGRPYWEHGVMVNDKNKKVKDFKTLLEKIKPDDIIFRHYENADRYKTNHIIKIPNIFDQNDGYIPVDTSESTPVSMPKLGGKLSRRRKTDKKKNKRVTKKSRKSRKSGK